MKQQIRRLTIRVEKLRAQQAQCWEQIEKLGDRPLTSRGLKQRHTLLHNQIRQLDRTIDLLNLIIEYCRSRG